KPLSHKRFPKKSAAEMPLSRGPTKRPAPRADDVKTERELEQWVSVGTGDARSLPPKRKEPAEAPGPPAGDPVLRMRAAPSRHVALLVGQGQHLGQVQGPPSRPALLDLRPAREPVGHDDG